MCQTLPFQMRERRCSPLRASLGTSGDHGSVTVWTVVETYTAIAATCLEGSGFVNDDGRVF